MTNKEKQQWDLIRIENLKIQGIENPEKIDEIVTGFYSVLIENCSINEAEKIVELLQQKINLAKTLILREPLENILKYRED